jgi:hypothetical protein
MGLVLGFAARGEAASYTFTKLEDTSGSFLGFGFTSINDVGTVAFWATLDAGGNGIFSSDGTTTTTIADNSGPFSSVNQLCQLPLDQRLRNGRLLGELRGR